ncbi:hypothetical protein ISN44_As11g021300 [Arabidopsis suecica]|uniref:Uncharacterized protein n=1 Tax=Arabidopsis suecica TaxID=45249 RepID=A0A8T1ZCK5_ARASU|nr:hypothetical protein ISN44_As11g021300 [Arabidopsis suecica]
MASQTNSYTVPEVAIGYPMPPSSATPPRRGWWSRPIVTMPADRKPTCKETTVVLTPCCGGIFTVIAVFILIFQFIDEAQCHAKFAIRSIAVSPSPTTWHVDFLVKNPSSMYTIYYGVSETALKLGPLNAAVLNTSHKRISRRHTAFSVDFVAEGAAALASVRDSCYLEFFADSVSVSNANVNANVSTADWRIGFVATSPVTGCKISLNRVQSRLFRGDQVISNSSSPSSDYFEQFVAGDKTNVRFEKVVMPEDIDDVIWDFRVEIMSAVNTDKNVNGFLMATCPDIPVKFTTDPAGNVVGSLFGNMRRCDFIFQHKLDSSS